MYLCSNDITTGNNSIMESCDKSYETTFLVNSAEELEQLLKIIKQVKNNNINVHVDADLASNKEIKNVLSNYM